MIYKYGYSIIGTSHLERNICCQDSHIITELSNEWILAAIADGVGSAKHSQIGSSIAVKSVEKFFTEGLPETFDTNELLELLKGAYAYAFESIEKQCVEDGEEIRDYDTTLSMVIYDGKKIVYGHCGDGGILGLTRDGNYVCITSPQKGRDGVSVIPLRGGKDKWEFNIYEQELAAIILVTDGILDIITPYLLRLDKNKLYVPMLMFLSNINCKPQSQEDYGTFIKTFMENKLSPEEFIKAFGNGIKEILKEEELVKKVLESVGKYCYPLVLMSAVTDDKTIVGIINKEVQNVILNEEYYLEPDWVELQNKWNKLAYPHLYKEKKEEKKNEDCKLQVSDYSDNRRNSYVAPPADSSSVNNCVRIPSAPIKARGTNSYLQRESELDTFGKWIGKVIDEIIEIMFYKK